MSKRFWIMIPARGGSRGVPRKNVRILGGVPLIIYAIRIAKTASEASRVVVITDDDEIDAVAAAEGVVVIREGKTTGRATLDEVAVKVGRELLRMGAEPEDVFLTLQPTCPLLRPDRFEEAITAFGAGYRSVITVVDDRHLTWRMDKEGKPVPDYVARVNRQQLEPHFRESGAIIGARLCDVLAQNTRIVPPIKLIELDKGEALDIDDFTDWAVAEHLVSRKRIVIRADAGPLLGMGHVYRALALSQELARHRVTLVTDLAMPLGGELFAHQPFEHVEVSGQRGFLDFLRDDRADLVILDQLDTTLEYVAAVKALAGRVVTFEDLGPGATIADLVVSDLYENLAVPDERQLSGVTNAILAPNFETVGDPPLFRRDTEHALIVFGGADPSQLTEKALAAMSSTGFKGRVSVVCGLGLKRSIDLARYDLNAELLFDVKHMPSVMRQADVAISSAGRTITELVSLGVPVLCLCQNEKELTHTHASARFGVVNLGLGELVGVETIAAHFQRMIDSAGLRKVLRDRALHETANRSNAAVIRRLLARIGWQNGAL